MARNLSTQDISWFLDLYSKEQLDLEPPYQRRSVWSPRDRQFFIDTILNNYPAPPVFLHKTINDQGHATYHVVDGKQRLKTIIDFTQDKVRIPEDFSDVRLQKKKWKDLLRADREDFWNYSLSVEMLPEVNDAYIRNIFDRINRNSRRLTNQEMRHAKYDGWFVNTVEAEAEKSEWKDFGLATPARMKRMAEVQFVSELFQVLIRRKIEGFDQDALDDLYAEYEDPAEQSTFNEDDFLEEVEKIKRYILEALKIEPEMRDFLKSNAHFYSLWSFLALNTSAWLPKEAFATKYVAFMRQVAMVSGQNPKPELTVEPEVLDYAINIRGASTDMSPRIKRHAALMVALYGKGSAHEDN